MVRTKQRDKDKVWYLENFSLFEELPQEALKELKGITVMQECNKRDVIYLEESESDIVYLCKEGRVKISRTSPEGKETTLYIVGPGQIFGEMALVGETQRSHRAEALDRTVLICSTPRHKFEAFLDRYPQVSRKVNKTIGERMRTIEKRFADMVFKGSEERVIGFLAEIGEQNKKAGVDEAYIRPFFTHEELAYLTATSRQTVTTILNELRDKEILTYKFNKMYIKDFSGLKKLAEVRGN